jgi:hypothetical protein
MDALDVFDGPGALNSNATVRSTPFKRPSGLIAVESEAGRYAMLVEEIICARQASLKNLGWGRHRRS